MLMMENRSFDQMFGSLAGVRGFDDSNALTLRNGSNVLYQPQGTNYVLPFHPTNQCISDVSHDWYLGHIAWNGGRWDNWIPARSPTAMTYCTRDDINFLYSLADAYTICDAYFCSVIGPTYPNRLYHFTGTVDPSGSNGGPVLENVVPANGFTWTTYAERLEAAGVSWRVYQSSDDYMEANPLRWFAQFKSAQPGDALYDRGLALVPDLVNAFRADVLSNTLPQVSWIVPGWSVSEHPPFPPSLGQALIQQLTDALASNPEVYNSTVFIITYDENGGFFDHVPSPMPAPGTAEEFISGWPIGPGFRVPTIIVSPWTRGGYVCSQVFDHTSTIRFLETWTGVIETNISAWRRQLCGDLTSAFDFSRWDTNYPTLPAATVATCSADYNPPVPSPQIVPTQEGDARPGRPLPYQPNALAFVDCASASLRIDMSNSGAAAAHYAIYANAFRNDGPWQYDVPGGAVVSDAFGLARGGTDSGGSSNYDLTCYGPNGFQRRFAGSVDTNCNLIEVTSTADANTDALLLTFANGTSGSVTFTVTDGFEVDGPWVFILAPGGALTNCFSSVSTNGGWYDLTVVTDAESTFLRRFSGHIEIGLAQVTGSRPARPTLSISFRSGKVRLKYPRWAGAYYLEGALDPINGPWTRVRAIPMIEGQNLIATLPLTVDAAFFRLRR
jgi:phospholipase C